MQVDEKCTLDALAQRGLCIVAQTSQATQGKHWIAEVSLEKDGGVSDVLLPVNNFRGVFNF